MNDIHAPYNFVPLARQVWFPEQPELVSQDIPFKDGLCGTLELRITAETPILLGAAGDGVSRRATVTPFQDPEQRYAIQGSSLRGLIRNVVEIASFGKMQRVDDRKLAVRDLTGGLPGYNKAMASTLPGGAFAALARGGWLDFRDGHWQLVPCAYSRVDHTDLKAYLKRRKGKSDDFFSRFGERPSAERKYDLYQLAGGCLDISFTPDPARSWPHSQDKKTKQPKQLHYSKALELDIGATPGRLVLTGQPNPGKKPDQKHMEFIFHSERAADVQKVDDVMRVFLEIYRETDEWKFWDRKRRAGERIPVFWLPEDQSDRARHIGLSQMFKLPYRNSLHEAIRNSSEDHSAACPDLADLLFGYLEQDAGGEDGGLRGRVSFSLARLVGEPRLEDPQHTVLNGPKPTYYPAYIRQKHVDKSGNLPTTTDQDGKVRLKQPWTTLMDPGAEVRGWKRYPVREQSRITPHTELQRPDQNGHYNTDVTVTLQPLAAGSQFSGRLRIHNLRPFELGALLWALDFGDGGHHALGMGKPFGLGRIRIETTGVSFIANDPAGQAPDLLACVEAFKKQMSRVVPNWGQTPQIRALQAMSDPVRSAGRDFNYLFLGEKEDNQFVQAKKEGKVLPEYVAIGNLGQKTPVRCPAKPSKPVEAATSAPLPTKVLVQETWGPLKLVWDKGRKTIKDIAFGGKRSSVNSAQVNELLAGLGAENADQLVKKLELKGVMVEVERAEGGNQLVVKSLSKPIQG